MEKLPAQMTVISISKPGGPEVLVPETRAVPAPGAGEILIKVAAAGVNRPDVAQRSGSYPPPPGASDLPGLEVAGEVVAIGTGVSRHRPGDRVMSLVAGVIDAGSRRRSGNVDDGLAQCVRARRA
jgi:NADPH2:quinone reductase